MSTSASERLSEPVSERPDMGADDMQVDDGAGQFTVRPDSLSFLVEH